MSREADLTYSPKAKDLKDVVHLPTEDKGGREVLIKIIERIINEHPERKGEEPASEL